MIIIINDHEMLGKGNGSVEHWRLIKDHLNYCIADIIKNTRKSPGDEKTSSHSTQEIKLVTFYPALLVNICALSGLKKKTV